MQYEFNDYRPKNPKDPGPWLTWTWPRELVGTYLWRIMFWTILVPIMLFGYILSPVGFLVQIIVIDFFSYLQYKNNVT